ncbi:TPA: ribonuclease H-like domain-containing protein [Salmonella enterica]|nr:ribonuclease H-like domain-containing protein [Salmonella enterica]HCH9607926.1 ribonuclease H-like domain-containing protein [Salmonella enterica]HDI5000220.1 ribonuclease H-like domain-containing protein [Salmonella enterica]HDI5005041.1 ribonuclease H-like domain-containing protein [Salmonella enterica]
MTKEDWKQKALEYRKQGLSSRKICDKLGWSRTKKSTINYFFERHDREQQAVDALFKSAQEEPSVKILYLDLEYTFSLSGHYDNWGVNIAQDAKVRESHLLSYSYAWNNGEVKGEILKAEDIQKDVLRSILNNDPKTELDFDMTLKLWHLLDQADVVIAHNARGYDIKQLNSLFLKYGLCLPSPYKIIDTLAIAKKMFKLPFKNLKYLAEFLGVTQKIETGGAKFWKLAAIGYSEDVMYEVLEYNKGDIYTLREVYLKLRGFSNDGVNFGAFNGSDELSCPSCSSTDLSKLNKQATTTRHQYDVYRCNHCQALSRSANVKGEAKYLVHVNTN